MTAAAASGRMQVGFKVACSHMCLLRRSIFMADHPNPSTALCAAAHSWAASIASSQQP